MPDISTPNLDYNNMVEAWDINDALMGGTLYMRSLGEAYLPKWPNEEPDSYKKRLAVATLLPTYEETIKQNVGRVFAAPTRLSDDTPEQIKEICQDVDLEGTCLDVWAQQLFSIGMQYGLAHILTDYPVIYGEVKTAAQEKEIGARPYAIIINPRQVIGWKSKTENGRIILTEIRIKEVVIVDCDDYGQTKIDQIRHIEIGSVKIWRKTKASDGSDTWAIHEEWKTSRKDIPLKTFYTKRTGFMKGEPPLLNLAMLNIKHWQSQSEQDNILHVARVPILTAFGLENGEELTIGSSCATRFSDKNTQGLAYVEHTGSAVNAGKESLSDLVEQMRLAGAKLLRDQNTATKSVDQTQEEKMQSNSPLFTMASSLEDTLDNVFDLIASWLNLPKGGHVDIVTEIEVARKTIDSAGAIAIQSLRQGGDIRRIDAVRALQRIGLIDPDAKPEEIIQELQDNPPEFME